MSKKRILHLITGLEVGGAEMMLLKTLPRLQDNFDHRVCCIRGRGPVGKALEDCGIPVYYIDLQSLLDIGLIFRFRNVIHDFQPNLLVTYLIHADLFGRLFGRIFGVRKILCSVRVKLVQLRYLPLLLLDGASSFMVDHYHFNSHTVAALYRRYFFLPEKKFTVIPNGLELEKFQTNVDIPKKKKELELPADATVITCVGRLEKQKGQAYLLKAFGASIKKFPKSRLLIVGEGSEGSTLESIARDLGIKTKVHFLGRRSDIPEMLKISDLFVLPSLYEGMSNALMEAMATKTPIIATKLPENEELISNGETGLLVRPKDSKSLEKAIDHLLAHPEDARKMAGEAENYAKSYFAIERVSDEMRDLFIRL